MTERGFNMSYIFWLSIFGSLTGFAGLVLHFWRFLREQPKIDAYFPTGDLGRTLVGYITSNQQDSSGGFMEDTSKFTFYIWTRISNQSEKPITFLEFELSIPNDRAFYLDSQSICNERVPVGDISSQRVRPLVKPIFTLEPYSAVEGYLFFGPYLTIPAEGTKAKLLIKATRKTFKVKLAINPVIPPTPSNT
jgi:hypothetical protein